VADPSKTHPRPRSRQRVSLGAGVGATVPEAVQGPWWRRRRQGSQRIPTCGRIWLELGGPDPAIAAGRQLEVNPDARVLNYSMGIAPQPGGPERNRFRFDRGVTPLRLVNRSSMHNGDRDCLRGPTHEERSAEPAARPRRKARPGRHRENAHKRPSERLLAQPFKSMWPPWPCSPACWWLGIGHRHRPLSNTVGQPRATSPAASSSTLRVPDSEFCKQWGCECLS